MKTIKSILLALVLLTVVSCERDVFVGTVTEKSIDGGLFGSENVFVIKLNNGEYYHTEGKNNKLSYQIKIGDKVKIVKMIPNKVAIIEKIK